MRSLEPSLAEAIKGVKCTQERLSTIRAQRTALRAARPQPNILPWDKGRDKIEKSADAFALLGLRARIASAFIVNSEAAANFKYEWPWLF